MIIWNFTIRLSKDSQMNSTRGNRSHAGEFWPLEDERFKLYTLYFL